MSQHINDEIILILASCYGGIVLVLSYDVLRILRRVFKASTLRVIIEDIIFWTIAAIFIFNIFLKYNYGSPRYFTIMVVIGVMCLFEWFIGRRYIDKISSLIRKIIEIILKPLKKLWKGYKVKLANHKRRINVWKKERKLRRGKEPQEE